MIGKRPLSAATIGLMCPSNNHKQLARWSPSGQFVEVACYECKKAWDAAGKSGRVSRILHRYSTDTGELLETVYRIGTSPRPYLVYEHQVDVA